MASEVIDLSHRAPAARISRVSPAPVRAVRVTGCKDGRGCDPRLLMKKLRLGGAPASGEYLASEPVSRIVERAAVQVLEAAGYESGGDGALELSLTLSSLDFNVMVGFSQCMLRGEIQTEAILTDAASGDVVWRGGIKGSGRSGTGVLVASVFTSLLDDWTLNLLAHPGLPR